MGAELVREAARDATMNAIHKELVAVRKGIGFLVVVVIIGLIGDLCWVGYQVYAHAKAQEEIEDLRR